MYFLTNGIRKYLHMSLDCWGRYENRINLLMENPKEMGADRIVNLVAAYEIYGGPALVIDYSTATIFDVVGKNGEFITGLTAPGLEICAEALYQRAAQLPKIEIKCPKSMVVKNTVDSLQAGIVIGHIGETIYIVNELKKQLGEPI